MIAGGKDLLRDIFYCSRSTGTARYRSRPDSPELREGRRRKYVRRCEKNKRRTYQAGGNN